MKKRYEFHQIVEAVNRYNTTLAVHTSTSNAFWNWIGNDCWDAYVKDYGAPLNTGGYFEMPRNPRLELLLSPHWQTLLKAWKIRNDRSPSA